VRLGAEEGRKTRPDLKLGVCGEHGGDPASVHFFHEVGLDYVSCSPFRVPVARLEAGRAALTAGALAAESSFFSFGTNDLTQTTWGMSRDDAETAFLPQYRDRDVLQDDPFATLDPVGVGRLVALAVAEGRAARPDLGLGVCGEHGGDPASIHWFHRAGLDYVSCSPPRVVVARLEAGRAAVLDLVGASDTR
jgi:pyruvate,orthophosphate dikinase